MLMNLEGIAGLLEQNKPALLQEILQKKELHLLLLNGLKSPLNYEKRVRLKTQLLAICSNNPALSSILIGQGVSSLLLLLYRFLPGWLLSDYQVKLLPAPGDELFSVVDEDDRIIGAAPRRECHRNPLLIHRVAHVLVFNPRGELILQKRSSYKDIQPGKWDTSVGGHLLPEESYETGAYREMAEELGIQGVKIDFLYKYPLRNETESENVATYLCRYNGAIKFDPFEITEIMAWSLEEIKEKLGSGLFTPNFEQEFIYYVSSLRY